MRSFTSGKTNNGNCRRSFRSNAKPSEMKASSNSTAGEDATSKDQSKVGNTNKKQPAKAKAVPSFEWLVDTLYTWGRLHKIWSYMYVLALHRASLRPA